MTKPCQENDTCNASGEQRPLGGRLPGPVPVKEPNEANRWHPYAMAKEIDRVRAQSALAVIKQHPGMVLFVLSPAIIALGLVWWLVSPTLAVLLLIGMVVGGGAVLLMKR